MAITEHRLSPPATTTGEETTGVDQRLPLATVIVLALAWVATLVAEQLLVPAVPDTPISALDVLIFDVFLLALGTTAVGLAARRRWAGSASLATSVFFLGMVFACPATGHHSFGLWWFGEFAVASALVAISGVVAWRSRRSALSSRV